jgi:hypothetical protein
VLDLLKSPVALQDVDDPEKHEDALAFVVASRNAARTGENKYSLSDFVQYKYRLARWVRQVIIEERIFFPFYKFARPNLRQMLLVVDWI